MTHVDLFGTPIKEGDFIVYAAVDGRSGTMRVGQVIALTYNKSLYGKDEPKVRVKSWSNFRAGSSTDVNDTRSGRQKDVTLSFLDRLIVIQKEMIPEKIWLDLNGPVCDYFGNPIK